VLDTSALRESRDFRLLELGSFLTGMGTQAGLVALPYQTYLITRSPFLTGLLGLVELVPLIAFSLYGGAIADRLDRRVLLAGSQAALVCVSAALAIGAFAHTQEVWLLYVLAGLLAGFGAFESVARLAVVPNVVPPDRVRFAVVQLRPPAAHARHRPCGGRPRDRGVRGRQRVRGGRGHVRRDGGRRDRDGTAASARAGGR